MEMTDGDGFTLPAKGSGGTAGVAGLLTPTPAAIHGDGGPGGRGLGDRRGVEPEPRLGVTTFCEARTTHSTQCEHTRQKQNRRALTVSHSTAGHCAARAAVNNGDDATAVAAAHTLRATHTQHRHTGA
jgi:hypothetical protein